MIFPKNFLGFGSIGIKKQDIINFKNYRWDVFLRGVMVKVLDSEIVVSEFKLQSRYYVHFRTNTLGQSMNPLIFPAMV